MAASDPLYLESLVDPWKAFADQVAPTSTHDGFTVTEASGRLDKLEIDLRRHLLGQVEEAAETPDFSLPDSLGSSWRQALDLCVNLVYNSSKKDCEPRFVGIVPRKLPFVLLEDCLDVLSVEDCKLFWGRYVEPSLDDTILEKLMWSDASACHLPFLKVCNKFLMVLEGASSSENHEWKGRVLQALAKGFSIADRSALKLWGTFHSANKTDFVSQDLYDNVTVNSSSGSLTYAQYQAFWSLQTDFAAPNHITVAEFIKKIRVVMDVLESTTSHIAVDSTPRCPSAKYLTAPALFRIQMSTPDLRSTFLCQLFIVASHLSSESPALATAMNPLLVRAKKLLQDDSPELVRILVDSILKDSETLWRQWKKDKCPAKAFAPKPKETTGESQDGESEVASIPDVKKANTSEYDFLTRDQLIEVSQKTKSSLPSLESHLEPYVEALDPEAGIEAEYHPGNSSAYTWRAMRLYAKNQLPLLKQCRRPADLELVTRQWYLSMDKEIPGYMPEVATLEESESEEEEPTEEVKTDNSDEVMNDVQNTEKEGDSPKPVESEESREVSSEAAKHDKTETQPDTNDNRPDDPMEIADENAEKEDAPTVENAAKVTESTNDDAVQLKKDDNVDDKTEQTGDIAPTSNEQASADLDTTQGDTTSKLDSEPKAPGENDKVRPEDAKETTTADVKSAKDESTDVTADKEEVKKDAKESESKQEDDDPAVKGPEEKKSEKGKEGVDKPDGQEQNNRRGQSRSKKRRRGKGGDQEPSKAAKLSEGDRPSRATNHGPGDRGNQNNGRRQDGGPRHDDRSHPPPRDLRHQNDRPTSSRDGGGWREENQHGRNHHGRRDDGPPRGGGGGRFDDGPRGSRRDDGPPPPRGHRDDGPPPPGRGGRGPPQGGDSNNMPMDRGPRYGRHDGPPPHRDDGPANRGGRRDGRDPDRRNEPWRGEDSGRGGGGGRRDIGGGGRDGGGDRNDRSRGGGRDDRSRPRGGRR